jgi:hypothetical protein
MIRRIGDAAILLVLLALWIPAIIAGLNAAGMKFWRSKTPLFGVTVAAEIPPATAASLARGEFQSRLAQAVGPSIPFYPDLVRAFNDVQYRMGLSSNRAILIGADGYLHSTRYAGAYCNREVAHPEAELRDWAKTIAELQHLVEARGQIFVYILTPGKLEHIPQTLPRSYPCSWAPKRPFAAIVLEHLARAGVNYVDGTAHVAETQGLYGYEPFPKNGIHWTDLASHAALNDMIETMNRLSGRQIAAEYDILAVPAAASNEENDFAILLNLSDLPPANPVGAAKPVYTARRGCPKAASIAVVGGSFFTSLGRGLMRSPCRPQVVQYTYLIAEQRNYDPNTPVGFTRSQIDYSSLASADVVILEENIGIVTKARHVAAFRDYLKTGELPHEGVY